MRTEHEHSPEAIRQRLTAGPESSFLRDWIYGGIDGAVTTFAVVSGVVGAELSTRIIVILGISNLLADGFSMAAGNYSGTKSEAERVEHLRGVELRHIDEVPDGEREEIRQIFRGKGFDGNDLERIVEVISADRERWVQTMLTEEYGLPLEVRSRWGAAWATFSAFVVCGVAPLVPYLLGLDHAFPLAVALTCGVFFAIGCARARWSVHPWWKTGLGTLGVGVAAAAVAYGVGHLLRQVALGG